MKKSITLTVFGLLFFCLSLKAQRPWDIIGRAKNAISTSINDISNTGHYTVNQTTNELTVLVSYAEQKLANDMNTTIDKLSFQNRLLMNKISDITNQIEDGKSTLVALEDNVALDLNQLLGNTILAKKEFIFRRISGFNHTLKTQGDYSFTIVGSSFGFNQESEFVKFTKCALNDSIDITSQINTNNIIDQNTRRIKLPSSELNKYFDPKKQKAVKVTLTVEHYERKGFINKKIKHTGTITNSFYLYLFPNLACVLTVEAVYTKADWIEIAGIVLPYTGPDSHCPSNCGDWYGNPRDFDKSVNGGHTPPLIGDEMLYECNLKQVAGPGGHDADVRCSIDPSQTRVTGHVRFRTRPTTYELSAKRKSYQYTSSAIEKQTFDANYDNIYTLEFPKTTSFVKLSGVSIASDQFFSFSATESNSVFEIIDTYVMLDKKYYLIRMKKPKAN
jgi:hypothetical protein